MIIYKFYVTIFLITGVINKDHCFFLVTNVFILILRINVSLSYFFCHLEMSFII